MSNKSDMGLAPITHIKNNLERLFGKGVDTWANWEMETISESLGFAFNELTRDKIHVLQLMAFDPKIFLEDISFFLHAVKTINNEITDFDYLPMPTSLELAFGIKELLTLSGVTKLELNTASDLIDVVSYLLIEEGFSTNIAPFDFIPKEKFTEGQQPVDIANKVRAIELYTKYMESL